MTFLWMSDPPSYLVIEVYTMVLTSVSFQFLTDVSTLCIVVSER